MRFATVDESEADLVVKSGGKLLTKDEARAQEATVRQDERAEKAGVAGTAASVVGAVGGAINPLMFSGGPGSAGEAYSQGVTHGLTAGLVDAAARKAIDATAGKEAGDRYAQHADDIKLASPTASGAGELAGFTAGMALPASPAGLIGKAGSVAERGAGLFLKGGSSALGRAAQAGVKLGARGAVEGGIYGGVSSAADDVVHDQDVNGAKLYSAIGHNALAGALLGAGLGAGGSLLASGAKAARAGVAEKLSRPAREAAAKADAEAARALAERRTLSPDFGGPAAIAPELRPRDLSVTSPGVDGPLASGVAREAALSPDLGGDLASGSSGLGRSFEGGAVVPEPKLNRAARRAALERGLFEPPPAEVPAATRLPLRTPGGVSEGGRLSFFDTADAQVPGGARALTEFPRGERMPGGAVRGVGTELGTARAARGTPGGARAFEQANVSPSGVGELGTSAFPRPVGGTIADIGVEPLATRIPNESAAGAGRAALGKSAPRGLGEARAFEDIFPSARAAEPATGLSPGAPRLAADQAWKAVGGGFGLQSTRYAKQAAKYFPNGTADLGDAVLRYRLIDIPENASPVQAAWQAARSGTPDVIGAKAASALDDVGAKLGAITEQSGARVSLRDVHQAVDSVRQQYARIAGYEHVVSALDNYEASLAQKLGATQAPPPWKEFVAKNMGQYMRDHGGHGPAMTALSRDYKALSSPSASNASASVQQLLEQRKGLDRLVYEEAKTMDPKGRVAALREVRAKLENVIADALDGASGKVPGQLRGEYAALKKDYHALSIIREAAEDSAARAAKGATLGLGEKFAVAQAVASGHLGAAPVLALGGKVLRERGNAAAAAFLTKMTEQQTVARLLRQADEAVSRASAGALREAPAAAPKTGHKPTAAEGRAEAREVQAKAAAIVKWTADVRANPQRMLDALTEAGAVVGRAAGPQTSAGYTQATLKAFQFIARYVPVKERRDPLDPRSVPPLTHEESMRLIRATQYATKPASVWADFERGVVTPEGIAAAQEFMPDQFADFRAQMLDHVTTHMSRGGRLTAAQRLRVDKLLGIPGGADLRPDALALLQANLAPEGPSNDEPPPAKSGGQSVDLKVQQSGFDAVEARKSAG